MTNKDIEITTVALLKSIIERGEPVDQWKSILQEKAIPLYIETTNQWKATTKEK